MKNLWILSTLIILLLTPLAVTAHPADNLCLPGEEEVQDLCVLPHKHLGLDNPAYFACWKEYQHWRRVLDKLQRETKAARDHGNVYVFLNNVVADQCFRDRRCRGRYPFRTPLEFPKSRLCSHPNTSSEECTYVDLITDYWDVIPMEVLARYPGSMSFCQQHIQAAKDGIAIQEYHLNGANNKLFQEYTELFRRAIIKPRY